MNRTVAIIVGLVVVFVVGLLGAAYYVAGTPQYSLYLLRRAIRGGDRATVDRLVDEDQVIARAVEKAVGGVPAGPRIVSQKATERLIPAANELLRERIEERLADPGAAPILSMEIEEVRRSGTAALVTLKDPVDGSTTTVTLLPGGGRHWKVVQVDLEKAGVSFTMDEVRRRAETIVPPNPMFPGVDVAPGTIPQVPLPPAP